MLESISPLTTREFIDHRERSLFGEWFDSLDAGVAKKVTAAITKMELGNLGDVKSVGGGVLERRLTHGPGYRIYFGRDGDTLIILLAGGTKRRQVRDIETAQARWAEYQARRTKS